MGRRRTEEKRLRDESICAAFDGGVSRQELAAQHGVSLARICQILSDTRLEAERRIAAQEAREAARAAQQRKDARRLLSESAKGVSFEAAWAAMPEGWAFHWMDNGLPAQILEEIIQQGVAVQCFHTGEMMIIGPARAVANAVALAEEGE